jgi:hypothetical protein
MSEVGDIECRREKISKQVEFQQTMMEIAAGISDFRGRCLQRTCKLL